MLICRGAAQNKGLVISAIAKGSKSGNVVLQVRNCGLGPLNWWVHKVNVEKHLPSRLFGVLFE